MFDTRTIMATSFPMDDPRTSPPAPLTPLIGRERELALAVPDAGAPTSNNNLNAIRGGAASFSRKEILRLLASGLIDPAIAAALFISVRTVESQVARIFAKLGVRTRTAAATAAIESGIIEPSHPTTA